MLMPRVNRVFRSRWTALWWAAGILFAAFRVATSDRFASVATAAPASPAASHAASDPWAIDSK